MSNQNFPIFFKIKQLEDEIKELKDNMEQVREYVQLSIEDKNLLTLNGEYSRAIGVTTMVFEEFYKTNGILIVENNSARNYLLNKYKDLPLVREYNIYTKQEVLQKEALKEKLSHGDVVLVDILSSPQLLEYLFDTGINVYGVTRQIWFKK